MNYYKNKNRITAILISDSRNNFNIEIYGRRGIKHKCKFVNLLNTYKKFVDIK